MQKNRNHKHSKHLSDNEISEIMKQRKHFSLALFFNIFAKKMSDIVGNAISFIVVALIVIVWAFLGPYYHFSDTWQLVINTTSSVVTFLVVFLIQNTQNRDTEIINLKLDELIKSNKSAKNQLLDLSELSDIELKTLEKEYIRIKNERKGE